MRQLAREALASDSVYRATAAMDLLFDAHESYGALLLVFRNLACELGPRSRQRLECCIGFLRLHENHREVLGKQYSEIMADCEHFRALAKQAEALLEELYHQVQLEGSRLTAG
ncbi:MAG TPA: hypothetical protein PKJ41_07610 [Bryobacteraceae bacterium]|nr:hypothetical protein [Bryobacteraceae bacterium]